MHGVPLVVGNSTLVTAGVGGNSTEPRNRPHQLTLGKNSPIPQEPMHDPYKEPHIQ